MGWIVKSTEHCGADYKPFDGWMDGWMDRLIDGSIDR